MKKITVLTIFLLIGINNFSYNVIKKGKNDYGDKIIKEKTKNFELELLFDAIQRGNNNYVKSHLEIEEHKEDKNNEKEKGIYGPSSLELNLFDKELKKWDVNVQNILGYSPIIKSIISKNNKILEVLLNNDASVMTGYPGFGKLTLHTAVYYENEEAINMLLDWDKNIVNAQSENDGWTALQEAVLKNNDKIVELLVERGANPSIKDYKGGSPTDMAVEFGKGKIVKILRDKIKENRKIK